VLVALTLATLVACAMLPRLRAEFAPEELLPRAPEDAARIANLLGPFGEESPPLLVLVRADDVLTLDALRFQHGVARRFEEAPWVARVRSLTTLSLPHLAEVAVDDEVTLDTLDVPSSDPSDEASSDTNDALARAIATDPARFPMGLLSLSERTGGRRVVLGPLVAGDTVTRAERDAIARFAERSHMARRALISDDHRLALIAIEPRADVSDEALEAHVREARTWVASMGAPRGVTAELAGMPEVRASMIDALRTDQARLVLFAVLGSFLVLAAGTRSWSGVLLPLASAGITSALVVGTMAAIDEPLNLLNNTVAPLLITIGLGDAVHVIARYREELTRTADRMEAARRTMRTMASACFLTAATTAVGFGSLVVSETAVVQRYAITAALGVLVGFAVTITFLPAALPGFAVAPERARGSTWLERATVRVAGFSARHAIVMIAVALTVLLGAAWIGRSVRVDSALSAQLDPSSSARRTFEVLETELSGVRVLSIGIHAPEGLLAPAHLDRLTGFEAWLRAQPNLLRVEGPGDVLGAMWAELAGDDARTEALASAPRAAALLELAEREAPELVGRTLADQGTRARFEVRLADAGERSAAGLVSRIEARLATWDGVDAVVAGEAARSARGLDRLLGDLGGSVGMSMLIIFVMIGAMLRSVRLGLISILPNVMPLSITLAYMTLRDIPLHAATMIVFSIAVGLAVDDTIHVLARYREEIEHGRPRPEAVLESLRSSGRAALLSTATLWVGYATLGLASFVPIRLFGELSLVALGSAIVCEILVMPALLATFGPKPARAVAAEELANGREAG
jgi:predicted RND superfamily exporter protein